MKNEGALVAFTLLLEWGTGTFLIARVAGIAHVPAGEFASLAAGVLTVSALGVSLLHLGRPARAWRALRNVRHSPVSREVAATLLFQALWVAWGLTSPRIFPSKPAAQTVHELVGWAAAIAALLAAWSVGPVYVATWIRTWRSDATTIAHLATALMLGGSTLCAFILVAGGPRSSVPFAAGVAAAAGVVSLLSTPAQLLLLWQGRPQRQRLGTRLPRGWTVLVAVRLALGAAAAVGAAFLVRTPLPAAWAVAIAAGFLLSELCGRWLFYSTGQPELRSQR